MTEAEQAFEIARNVEPPRHPSTESQDDMTSMVLAIPIRVVIPDGGPVDAVFLPLEGGQLDPDRRGDRMAPIVILPLGAHFVFVDRPEVETIHQLAGLGETHAIATAKGRKDELVLGVVTNSLHQVVEVDDQDRKTELVSAEGRGGARRAATDHQDVEDLARLAHVMS